MNNALNGSFIFVCTENIKRTLTFVRELKEESEKPQSQLFTLSRVS
jgi:hypothetical protein